MKLLVILTLLLMGITSLCSLSPNGQIGYRHDLAVIPITDLNEQQLQLLMQGDLPDLAVEFSAGTQLPFQLSWKGNFVQLATSEPHIAHLEVRQPFFVRCVEKEVLLSLDLKEWKPCWEFVTGCLGFAFSIQENQPSISAEIETNIRK